MYKFWIIFYSDGNDLELVFRDSVFISNGKYNLSYQFKTKKSNKGYIGFAEVRDNFISSGDKGFIISYVCDPIDSLWIRTDPIAWAYDTTSFPPLHIILKGKTNAYCLFMELHGSGLLDDHKIPIAKDGSFYNKIPQWSAGIDNTILHVFGTINWPKKIILKNPKIG